MMRYTICVATVLAIGAYAYADASAETLTGVFKCISRTPTASLGDPQTTNNIYASDDQTKLVQMSAFWSDSDETCDFKHQFTLAGPDGSDTKTIGDTNGNQGAPNLSITLDNKGLYKRKHNIKITASAWGIYNCSGYQSATDSIDMWLVDEGHQFTTKTFVNSPASSVYKWADITVSGSCQAEHPTSSGSWKKVQDDTVVRVSYSNGGFFSSGVDLYTDDGEWSHTFSCPTTGWTMFDTWDCTAYLKPDQMTEYGASTEYKSSSKGVSCSVYSNADAVKDSVMSLGDVVGGLYNPLSSIDLQTTTTSFNLAGETVGSDEAAILAGGTNTLNYTGPGSTAIHNGGFGVLSGTSNWAFATTSGGGFVNALDGLTAQWGYVNNSNMNSNAILNSDPPPGPVDVLVTVYGMDGSPLGSEVFVVNPNGTVIVSLPDDIPGLPESGSGTVSASTVGGEEVLSGMVVRENLDTGAISGDEASLGVWQKLSAPLVDVGPAIETSLFIHNPTETNVEIAIDFYDDAGTYAGGEASLALAAHASHQMDASAYVGSPWRGSAEVNVLVGEGVSGTLIYDLNGGSETASMLIAGETARRLCLPKVGDGIDWTGLYCLHNPSDETTSGTARFLNADGSLGSQIAVVLAPHASVYMETDPLEQSWMEPTATFDFEVTDGQGGVVGGALLIDPVAGSAVSAGFVSVPVIVHADAPVWDAGWNLISVPAGPINTAVESVLALAAETNTLEKRLFGYTQAGGYDIYPVHFTTMRWGKGYWLYLDTPARCEFLAGGASLSGDVRIDLETGWTLWGFPFTEARLWDNCLITDGDTTRNPSDADAAGWIQRTIYGFDGGYYSVPGDVAQVEPWHAYWLLAYQPGLTLIVPSP